MSMIRFFCEETRGNQVYMEQKGFDSLKQGKYSKEKFVKIMNMGLPHLDPEFSEDIISVGLYHSLVREILACCKEGPLRVKDIRDLLQAVPFPLN